MLTILTKCILARIKSIDTNCRLVGRTRRSTSSHSTSRAAPSTRSSLIRLVTDVISANEFVDESFEYTLWIWMVALGSQRWFQHNTQKITWFFALFTEIIKIFRISLFQKIYKNLIVLEFCLLMFWCRTLVSSWRWTTRAFSTSSRSSSPKFRSSDDRSWPQWNKRIPRIFSVNEIFTRHSCNGWSI